MGEERLLAGASLRKAATGCHGLKDFENKIESVCSAVKREKAGCLA
jgi:hypothetical protein